MTTRHTGYIVVLEKDIREDDAEAVITALTMVRGVLTITPIEANPESRIAEERVRQELRIKLFAALERP
jgi:hypothetical protein